MRIIHTIAALHLDDGGPTRSVSQLAAALAGESLDVHLVAGRDPEREVVKVDPRVAAHSVAAGHSTMMRRLFAGGFRSAVVNAAGQGRDVVLHTHGIWLRQSRDTIAAARQLDVPVVLSPRGMLEPWAMAYRAWRKRTAWWLYQRRDLRSVTAFHATAEMEAESIRRLGFPQPIIVLPNGVSLPVWQEHPIAGGRIREALFLSRIHPKKGIDLLVEAWARIRPAGWRLTLAGNDDGGHVSVVERQIRESGLGDVMRYVGPAYGTEKERLFRSADLFVLPSHSENFGIVVAEALAYGVPVITTTGTPWSELVSEHCGWHVPASVDGIASALAKATRCTPAELSAMGLAGRQLVETRYGWQSIAGRFAEAYQALAARDMTALAALPFVRTT